ncbi:MAG: preprotein translocase subunit YajC [Acidobacteria bacterium]|nr:preprotein translocase subunit YajC [Acidobacteriota bacterium]
MNTHALLLLQGGASVLASPLVMMALIFGVFYFLIIRPQQKRQQALRDMIALLKAGDKVITTGGIYATVKQVKEKSLLVMSADKSILEISRSAVAGMQGEEEAQK